MKQRRWQQITEWPLTAVAVAFLAAYAWEVIADLHGAQRVIAETVINTTWLIFAIDYFVNLVLAEHRWVWFRKHLFDLAVVVLPILRPLRLLRLVTLLNILNRTTAQALRGKIVTFTIGAVALLVFVASLAVLDVERGAAGSSIKSLGDALWWAFVTITTVGYGDMSPATATGRVIGVGLMVGGIALIGVVTATLASWIVDAVTIEDKESIAQADRIEAKLDALLAQQESSSADLSTGDVTSLPTKE